MIRSYIHIILHFIFPWLVARKYYPEHIWKTWLIMVLTMVVDLDHFLATPVFSTGRCSIGFHPLHTYPVIAIYVLLVLIGRTRLVGLGLILHMGLDMVDCVCIVLGLANDVKINVIFGGHYATEILGIKALLLRKN